MYKENEKSQQEREIFVMRCKHPIFNVTWSVSSKSQVDRPPTLPSIPGETKALTDRSQFSYEPVGGTDVTKFLPPFK